MDEYELECKINNLESLIEKAERSYVDEDLIKKAKEKLGYYEAEYEYKQAKRYEEQLRREIEGY